ncbi:hypothetical protein EUGRSUZ_E02567 [Eucalyptus grandis]|uniref:Uncharacterized protein n=2 Tax=Eucalyptus grandis TaxID=71139 RepID=A0ACC3KXK8_EUCGR|nr:hypothetical protein EUGRSUZ_E02567 [Eucalyptus grandis]
MHLITENQFLIPLELQGCPMQALSYIRKANRSCYWLGEENMRIRVRNSLMHAQMHTGNSRGNQHQVAASRNIQHVL